VERYQPYNKKYFLLVKQGEIQTRESIQNTDTKRIKHK
jgi:hypothetical protein